MGRYRGIRPSPKLLQDFRKAVLKTFYVDDEIEQCGLLVLWGPFLQGGVVPVTNSHPEPSDNFGIKLREFIKVQSRTEVDAVVGIVHTHLDRHSMWPSKSDIRSISSDLIGCVYHVPSSRTSWYTCDGAVRYKRRS